jgi:hypothetical protein
MQAMAQSDSSIRRWCRQCGLSSQAGRISCANCEAVYQRSASSLLTVLQNSPPYDSDDEEVDIDAFVSSLQNESKAQSRGRFYFWMKWIGLAIFFVVSIVWSNLWIRLFELLTK